MALPVSTKASSVHLTARNNIDAFIRELHMDDCATRADEYAAVTCAGVVPGGCGLLKHPSEMHLLSNISTFPFEARAVQKQLVSFLCAQSVHLGQDRGQWKSDAR